MSDLLLSQADPLLLAFERNSRVNAAVLAAISDDDLTFATGGGWSIGKHLCHLASFRKGWLYVISPARAEALRPLIEFVGEEDFNPLATTVEEIAEGFREGDAAALAAVQEALAEGRAFEEVYQSNPVNFLVHAVVHDAHHRGQVVSLLRQNGRTFDEMEALDQATWPIWRE